MPVHTAWDLGILDPTAIWFFQAPRSGELRFIDYYEDNDEPMPEYLRVLADKKHLYGKHLVPHDIAKREFGTGKTSEEVAAELGWKLTRVPNIGLEQGIAATKMAFDRMFFDAERCAVGLQRLAHYRRAYNTTMGEFKPVPVHDIASHGSDALRMAVVGYAPSRISTDRPHRDTYASQDAIDTGWMGA
jgi:phage terminase large subunit